MQSEGHFLFVDLIMLSSFVTPCFFPIISLSGSLVKPEDAEETPREQVSKYQRWQMGKTTFFYLSMLIFADVFRIVATGDKGKAASWLEPEVPRRQISRSGRPDQKRSSEGEQEKCFTVKTFYKRLSRKWEANEETRKRGSDSLNPPGLEGGYNLHET